MRHTREIDGAKIRHGLVFDDPIELIDMVADAGAAGRFNRYLGYRPFAGYDLNDNYRDVVRWLGRSDFKGWTGPDSVREAVKTVWNPGEDRVKKLLGRLAAHPFVPPRDLRRRATWRDDGEGDFELDRFCDGREAWRGPKRREVIGRQFLTFVVDVAANCHVGAADMYWRAAVAIACAQTLEEFGYGVEVVACANLANTLHPPGRPLDECDEDDGRRLRGWDRDFGRRKRVTPGAYQDVAAAVWIKRPDDPVDLAMLTAVCSPWFFRLGFFGLFGMIPGTVARFSLGSCVELEDDRVTDLIGADDVDRERVKLAEVWQENTAVELMRATLRRFADPAWIADNPEKSDG